MKKQFLFGGGVCLVVGMALVACGDNDGSTGGSANQGGTGQGGAAGGGGNGSGGDTPIVVPADYVAACEADATAQCTQYFTCFPDTGPFLWGSIGQCEDALAGICGSYYREDGASVAEIEACSAAHQAVASDCAAWGSLFVHRERAANYPSECRFTGPRQTGEACEIHRQCDTGFCGDLSATNGKTCGSCIAPPMDGEPCNNAGCGYGTRCFAGTCRAMGQLNDVCDNTQSSPCDAPYRCDAGACVEQLALGMACTPTTPAEGLGIGSGFQCAGDTICNDRTNVCEAIGPAAAIGESCGYQADDSFNLCDDSWCDAGTCVAKVNEGEACTSILAPFETLTPGLTHIYGSDCIAGLPCFDGVCGHIGDRARCQ